MADIFENNDLSGLFSDVFGEGAKTWISLSNYSRTGMTTFTRYCQKCGAKLRLPQNMGKIDVRCPKCGFVFSIDTGEDPARAQQTPPAGAQSAPPPAAGRDENELDAYRSGGRLRMDPPEPGECHDTRVLLRAILACRAASMVENFFDRESVLWKEALDPNCAALEYVTVRFESTEMVFDLHSWIQNRKEQDHTYRYTYNDMADRNDAPAIGFADYELELMRAIALSHLVDIMPTAVMRNGRIYEK